ncbi:MAG: hypothetical protein M3Z64_10615, partial [Verrucomicrobiota bacterium]|nr:hypothetical protein [Verrucomicrobiota bacterium]
VSTQAFDWGLSLGGARWNVSAKWVVVCVAVIGIGAAIAFPARSAVFLKNRPKVRPIAAMVNAGIPDGETLYAVNPLFQPYLFYIEAPIRYVVKMDELPAAARYFVMAPEEKPRAQATAKWQEAHPRFVLQTPAYRGHETLLYRIDRR